MLPALRRKYTCLCCGWPCLDVPPYKNWLSLPVHPGLKPPYEQHFGMASYEVCLCCGFEFGHDDDFGGETFQESLEKWIARGAPWFWEKEKPEGWSLERQLKDAGIVRLGKTGL